MGILDQLVIDDGGTVFCNYKYRDNLFVNIDGAIIKYDKEGNIDWAKKIARSNNINIRFEKIKALSDGSYIILGQTFDLQDMQEHLLTAKFSATGNLIWCRSYSLSSWQYGDHLIRPQQVEEDSDGNIYLSFHLTSHNYTVLVKLTPLGTISWSKGLWRFVNDSGPYGHFGIALCPIKVNNNTLNVIGVWSDKFITMQINSENGAVITTNQYALPPTIDLAINTYDKIQHFKLENGNFVLAAGAGAQNTSNLAYKVIVEFDSDLTLLRSFSLKSFSNSYGLRDIIVEASGNILYQLQLPLLKQIYIGTVNLDQKIISQKKLSLNGDGYGIGSAFNKDKQGNIRLTPVYYVPPASYGIDVYNLNIDNRFDNCFQIADSNFSSLSSFQMQSAPFTFSRTDDNVLQEDPFPVTVADILIEKQDVCKKISTCDQLKINGPGSICINDTAVVFTATKNESCLRNISWAIDTSVIISTKKTNDTTLVIHFKKEWRGYLHASLDGCVLKDSIAINVYREQPADLLGADTTFCKGDSLTLNAGVNYFSYSWNNGSTSSSIAVKTPGKYSIKVLENTNGCYLADTITIGPLYSMPHINLNDEIILCPGKTDTLSPGNFASYTWQDGSSLPFLPVNNPGVYSLMVKDIHGCKANKEIVVKLEDCNPRIFFPSAFTPNKDGKNDLFKPSAFGVPEQYEFIIYNRWGQPVFKTNDPHKGWDGTINGLRQNNAVFAWVCHYKFPNQPAAMKKGTVFLIR